MAHREAVRHLQRDAAGPICCNVRVTFSHCSDILLARCPIHPQPQETLFTSCPNPKATFRTFKIQGKCDIHARDTIHAACEIELQALREREAANATSMGKAIELRAKVHDMEPATAIQVKQQLVLRFRLLEDQSRLLFERKRDVEARKEEALWRWMASHSDAIGRWEECYADDPDRPIERPGNVWWATMEDDNVTWTWGIDN